MPINVDEKDLRVLLLCTFRYSLGRMSYMPGLAQDLIKKYKNVFNIQDFQQMAEDITTHEGFGPQALGMDFDREGWLKFRDWCNDAVRSG